MSTTINTTNKYILDWFEKTQAALNEGQPDHIKLIAAKIPKHKVRRPDSIDLKIWFDTLDAYNEYSIIDHLAKVLSDVYGETKILMCLKPLRYVPNEETYDEIQKEGLVILYEKKTSDSGNKT